MNIQKSSPPIQTRIFPLLLSSTYFVDFTVYASNRMRVAVISDIHSNLPALEKVFTIIDQIGVDRILCLGDIVGLRRIPQRMRCARPRTLRRRRPRQPRLRRHRRTSPRSLQYLRRDRDALDAKTPHRENTAWLRSLQLHACRWTPSRSSTPLPCIPAHWRYIFAWPDAQNDASRHSARRTASSDIRMCPWSSVKTAR